MVESESNPGLDAMYDPMMASAPFAPSHPAFSTHRTTAAIASTHHNISSAAAAAAAPQHAPVMVVDAFGIPKIKQCACCGCTSTPLWRDAGKNQPLCNACGIRWKKYSIICDTCNYVPCKQERDSRVCRRCGTSFPGNNKRRVMSPNATKRPLVFYTPKPATTATATTTTKPATSLPATHTLPQLPPQSAFTAPAVKRAQPYPYPSSQTAVPQMFTASSPLAMSSIPLTHA